MVDIKENYQEKNYTAAEKAFNETFLPDSLLKKIELVGNLYKQQKVSLGEAGLILGVTPYEVENILGRYGLTEKKKILVCGAAGFIGSNFVHYMLDKYPHYDIIVYDILTYAGNLENLRPAENKQNYKFILGDITDAEKLDEVLKTDKYEAVINFAAESHVGRSVHGKAGDFVATNVIGVYTILEAVRKHNILKYIQISTDEVYGTVGLKEDRTFTEDSPFLPNVPYAAAKAGGDFLCRAYYNTYKTPVVVTHCSNNYGPYQHPEKMIPYFIFRAMNNRTIPLHGDGCHVRDWIFAQDHGEAIDIILHNFKSGEVYNIGSDNERPNIEIAKLILNLLGRPHSLISFVPDRPGNDLRYSINAAKIRTELNWKPRHTFEDAMPKTIQWYQNNLDWVEKIKERDKEFTNFI